MFPILSRPNAVELCMRDPELFRNHLQSVFIVEQEFLNDSNFALR